MPMEADREARFEMVLGRHMGLPEAERPVLVFRHPMRRDTRRLTVVLEKLKGLTESSDEAAANAVLDELEGLVKSLLIDWRGQCGPGGVGVAFDLEQFDLLVDESDLGELAARLRVEPGLTLAEKKTSGLGFVSNMASFAPGAAEAAEDATARPTNESDGPSLSNVPGAAEAAEPAASEAAMTLSAEGVEAKADLG